MSILTIGTVPVAGGSLVVHRRRAAGPALLFLHYWGGSARTWDRVIGQLGALDTAAYDQRGWGTASSLAGPYSLDQLASDVDTVVAREGLDRVVLVGHSMGGKIAQIVAGRRPAYLAGLVLVAPAPPRPPAHVTDEYQRRLAHAYDSAESVEFSIENVLTHSRLSEELRRQVLHDSLDSTPAARAAWPLEGIVADVSTSTKAITVPTVVIAGEYDQVEPPVVLEDLLTPALARVRLTVIPGVGHLLPLEAPAAVVEEIRRFIENELPGQPTLPA
ncbi:alpha/beta fold hydrolase [Frankia gtarii]|uniref:alpha/beta fold hydrolase n=1 Tax=Frankia gtarii TaxID=2950102 RepID=UPI0021BE0238|nr:alpha/beta hydrolase [Frankia gtarii]